MPNNKNSLNRDYPKFLVTDTDVSSFIESIASVKSLVFSVRSSAGEKSLSDLDIPSSHKDYILSRFNEENISTEDRNKMVSLLDLMSEEIKELPVYNAKLAFEPSRTLIEELGVWCRKQWGKSAILSIEVDPSIIGGIILTVNGAYLDFSTKSKLSKQFQNILAQAKLNL